MWNGPWSADDEESVRTWDDLLRRGRWLPAVGNSDAHREPQVVGLPQTVVLAEDLTTDAVLDGLRVGRCYLAESADRELSDDSHPPAGDRRDRRAPGGVPRPEGGRRGDRDRDTWLHRGLIGAPGTVAVAAAASDGSATTTRPRDTGYLRAEMRRPLPTATTPDTMVATSNPVFLVPR